MQVNSTELAPAAPQSPMTPDEFAEAYEKGWTKTVRFLISKGVAPSVEPTSTPEGADVSQASCDAEERRLIEATAQGYASQDLARLEGYRPSTIRVRLMRLSRRLIAKLIRP